MQHALKVQLDEFCENLVTSNALFTSAKQGLLGPDAISHYLFNIHYLVEHTPIHLEMARQECGRRGLSTLDTFFQEKINEEKGHDVWAEDDIAKVQTAFHKAPDHRHSKKILRLIETIQLSIMSHPALYLMYILYAEYVVVRAAPTLVDSLVSHCGFSKDMFSVLLNHVELDRQHILDNFKIIERAIPEDVPLGKLQQYLALFMELSSEFYSEVGLLTKERVHSDASSTLY